MAEDHINISDNLSHNQSVKACPLIKIIPEEPKTNVKTNNTKVPPHVIQTIFPAGIPFIFISPLDFLLPALTNEYIARHKAKRKNIHMVTNKRLVKNGALKSGFSSKGISYPTKKNRKKVITAKPTNT
uniref:hypothetical protein n=1 Tax=Segatella hominis TaxID=2518605 RepID=UPI0025890F2C|nr:hypothetical protein [Prevotella sp.]